MHRWIRCLLFGGYLCFLVDGICRRMEFLDCIQDKYMNGTLIRTYTTSEDLCEIKCFKEIACLSYNLGPIDSQTGMRLCELNYAETSTSASPPVDKTGFMYCQASSVCSSNPCEAPLSCTPSFVAPHDTPVCIQSCTTQRPLGMESGEIPDPSVTASSYWYNTSDHAPWLARLHGTRPVGSWSSQYYKEGEYLQVDVGRVVHLTMVATQGRLTLHQWVTVFELAYSASGNSWSTFHENGQIKKFQANKDSDTEVPHPLGDGVSARYVRFVAIEWHHHISMRVELYGCG
ncbi:lactadherin [Nematostella vectensis]|uniref:lactadherin n=1 Tax=Nematostella vectensis TaxID=45351 RepID=UPI0020770244|nr:lactadherin [Nematostella vectensis]